MWLERPDALASSLSKVTQMGTQWVPGQGGQCSSLPTVGLAVCSLSDLLTTMGEDTPLHPSLLPAQTPVRPQSEDGGRPRNESPCFILLRM